MKRYLFKLYSFDIARVIVVAFTFAGYIGHAEAQMPEDELQRVVKACAAKTAKHIFGIQGLQIDESKPESGGNMLINGHYFNQHMSGGIGEESFKFAVRASQQANRNFTFKVLSCE